MAPRITTWSLSLGVIIRHSTRRYAPRSNPQWIVKAFVRTCVYLHDVWSSCWPVAVEARNCISVAIAPENSKVLLLLTPVALSFQVPMAHHDRAHGHMMAAASPFWWPSIMCYPTLGPPISTGHLQSSRLRPIKQQNIIIQPQFLNKLEILKS